MGRKLWPGKAGFIETSIKRRLWPAMTLWLDFHMFFTMLAGKRYSFLTILVGKGCDFVKKAGILIFLICGNPAQWSLISLSIQRVSLNFWNFYPLWWESYLAWTFLKGFLIRRTVFLAILENFSSNMVAILCALLKNVLRGRLSDLKQSEKVLEESWHTLLNMPCLKMLWGVGFQTWNRFKIISDDITRSISVLKKDTITVGRGSKSHSVPQLCFTSHICVECNYSIYTFILRNYPAPQKILSSEARKRCGPKARCFVSPHIIYWCFLKILGRSDHQNPLYGEFTQNTTIIRWKCTSLTKIHIMNCKWYWLQTWTTY